MPFFILKIRSYQRQVYWKLRPEELPLGRVGGEKERKGLNIEGRGGEEKMPFVFHQEANFPKNQKDFALRQQY